MVDSAGALFFAKAFNWVWASILFKICGNLKFVAHYFEQQMLSGASYFSLKKLNPPN